MSESPETRELQFPDMRDLFELMRNYWRQTLSIILLCTLLALGWALIQPKLYSATATGLVIATGEQDLSSRLAGVELAKDKAVTYESLANSRSVAEQVIAELRLDTKPELILDSITVEVPAETAEIRITAWDNSPEGTVRLADAWMVALTDNVHRLENTADAVADTAGHITIQPLMGARMPDGPSQPNVLLHLAGGFLIGLVFAIVFALIRRRMYKSQQFFAKTRPDFRTAQLNSDPW